MGPFVQRRYQFHRDENETLTLVFDERLGHWRVEVTGPKLTRSHIPLQDFERSEDGRRLASQLDQAIGQAVRDV